MTDSFARTPALPAALILLLFSSPGTPAYSSDVPGQKPVATVNGVHIYESDLECAVEATRAQRILTRSGLKPAASDREEVQRSTLDRLIDVEILYQESLKNRFPGLSKMVEESYSREVKRLGGESAFQTALRCNDMTPEQFRQSIFRNLSINRYLDKMVYSRIRIEEDEVEQFYHENRSRFARPPSARLKQILVRIAEPDETSSREVETRARQIYEQALGGTDFSILARKYSDDPASAAAGGDVGVVFKGSLRSGLDTVVFSLSPGRVTEPLRSHHGYYIFKVINTWPPSTPPLEEVRERVVSALRQEKIEEGVAELLEKLKSEADVVIHDQ